MKTKLLIFILTILSLLYCLSINAQVTIGSYEKPIAGALLDLKEQTPSGENTTGTKGFGLPRVNLKKQSPKTPSALSASIGGSGDWGLEEHVGLTVFNNDPTCYPIGVYVWSGQKWTSLGKQQIEDGSYESDVEALKLFYNSNPSNTLNWDIENGDPTAFTGTIWAKDNICGNHRLKRLSVQSSNITSDRGINEMSQLTHLSITSNQLTSLNVSANRELINIYCSGNSITSLDVSQNTKLLDLRCGNNQIGILDLTYNLDMTRLECQNNVLTTLKIGNKKDLTYISCGTNRLSSIDVTQSPNLVYLWAATNKLTAIDLTQNIKLTTLALLGNQLTSLNVALNKSLTYLVCSQNQLKALDVTQNTLLATLRFGYNQLAAIDITQNTLLTELTCDFNWMTQSDLDNLKANNPNYCNIASRKVTPQYIPNTTTSTSLVAPTCP